MSLPSPKLDDRDFDSLVEEAKKRIAAKCPEWTDFNASDPGMMLVELMAWMTETVLYQVNRVPDANYIKFLELAGLRLRPGQPARAWVFLRCRRGIQRRFLSRYPGAQWWQQGPKVTRSRYVFAHLATSIRPPARSSRRGRDMSQIRCRRICPGRARWNTI